MISYDLTREEWIPVLMEGGDIQELGLRDVLTQAPHIREIAHDSPLFVASIHPVLTAVLQRVLGGTTFRQREAEWKRWWKQGHFDVEAIDLYFQKWHDRFDLFHAKYPFYQVANLEMAEKSPLFRLAMEENNAPAMFANRADPDWVAPPPALAAQLVVTIQNFALGFGRSSKAKIAGQEIEPPYSADGPLLRGLTVWPSGENLFRTLMLALVPHELNSEDKPCWELDAPHQLRDELVNGKRQTKPPLGVCDRLTLQSRLLRLLPEEKDGVISVPFAYFTQGRSLEKDEAGRPSFHPLKLYVPSTTTGVMALGLSEGKAIWRNAHSLFSKKARGFDPQNSLAFTARLTSDGFFEEDEFHPRLNVVGMATEPGKAGKFLLWRYDRLPFAPTLLTDANLVEQLGHANADADLIADELRARFARVARVFVAGGKDSSYKPDPDDVKALVDKFDPRRAFWPRLAQHFTVLLQNLADEPAAALEQWETNLQNTARDSLHNACDALGTAPHAIVAVAQIDLEQRFNLAYLRDPQGYSKGQKLRAAAKKASQKTRSTPSAAHTD